MATTFSNHIHRRSIWKIFQCKSSSLQIAMKEQDRSLMKQFIDLRSTILQLRCVLEMHSSNSDVSSYGGSNISLDDTLNAGSPILNRKYLSVDMEATEFRSRTCSLLTPRKAPITRIKWKSNEYIWLPGAVPGWFSRQVVKVTKRMNITIRYFKTLCTAAFAYNWRYKKKTNKPNHYYFMS